MSEQQLPKIAEIIDLPQPPKDDELMDSIRDDHSIQKRDVIMVNTKHSSPSLKPVDAEEDDKILNVLTKEVKFG